MGEAGGKRGLLKPVNRLQWQPTFAPVKPKVSVAPKAVTLSPKAPAPKGLPSNAKPQSQYTLEQIQKMAAARGLSVEKLLAQMIQQYLKEE